MKKHQLQYQKAYNPCTYRQIECLRKFTNVRLDVRSTSQMLKRLEMSDASDLIDLAKKGEKILVTDK